MAYTRKKLVINTIFVFLSQFATLIFPLITTPFISAVLGAENIGKVNFANSVVEWFVIIASFGVQTYGIKEVAKKRDDKLVLSKFISEMLAFELIMTAVTSLAYILLIFIVPKFSEQKMLFLVVGITILLNAFSFDWFFQGIEEFTYITIRSLFFKIIAIVCMFLLIKNSNDYIIYAGISVFALSAANIFNLFYCRKFIKWQVKDLNIFQHFKPMFIFFILAIITSMYTTVDKIILGFYVGDSAVAFFTRAKMINAIAISVVLTINTTLLPRLNNYFVSNKGRYDELRRLSLDFMMLLAIPIVFGEIAVADWTMFMFGGQEFAPSAILLKIIAPTALIVPLGTWNQSQRMIPLKKEKQGLIFVIIVACLSLIMNFVLLQFFDQISVAITWLTVELVGFSIIAIYLKKKDGFSMFRIEHLKYIISSAVMFVSLYFIQKSLSASWLNLFLVIFIGMIIYLIMLIIVKEKFTWMLLKKLFRRKK